jgi:hypothetical protein
MRLCISESIVTKFFAWRSSSRQTKSKLGLRYIFVCTIITWPPPFSLLLFYELPVGNSVPCFYLILFLSN